MGPRSEPGSERGGAGRFPVRGVPLCKRIPVRGDPRRWAIPVRGDPPREDSPGARRGPVRGSSPLPAADSTLTRPRCRRGAPTGPPLTPPALALSTARLCQPSLPCQPCLRVRLAVPAAGTGCGLGWAGFVPGEPWEGEPRSRDRPTCVSNRRCPAGIRGLQLDFLELGSNRAGWLQVWRRHRAPGDVPVSAGHPAGMGMGGGAALTPCSPQWQVQFDCFPAESGRRVLVTLRTIPDRGLAVSRSHVVAIELQGKSGRERGARKGWHRLTLPMLPRTHLHPHLAP